MHSTLKKQSRTFWVSEFVKFRKNLQEVSYGKRSEIDD